MLSWVDGRTHTRPSAAFARQMDEFIEVAQGSMQPWAGGREGREALRLSLATLRSARSAEVGSAEVVRLKGGA
jgi:predicted dehydrogenase